MELTESLNGLGYSFEELREDLEANDFLATESAKFATMFQSLMDETGIAEAKAKAAVQYGLEGKLGEFASLEGLSGQAWSLIKRLVLKIIGFLNELGQRILGYLKERKNERQSLKNSAALVRAAYGSGKVGKSELRDKMFSVFTQVDTHLINQGYLSNGLSLLDGEFNSIIDDALRAANALSQMAVGNEAAMIDFKGYSVRIQASQSVALKLITKSKQFVDAKNLQESITKTRDNLIALSLKSISQNDASSVEKYFSKISARDFEKLYTRTRESVARVNELTQATLNLSSSLKGQPDPKIVAEVNSGVSKLNELSSLVWSYCALEFFVYERLRNTVAMMGMVSKQALK